MRACNYLGYLYAKGLGGPQDTEKARDIYQEACDKGTLSSCASLGSLYQDSGNKDDARQYFRKACDGGLTESCSFLEVYSDSKVLQLAGQGDLQVRIFAACFLAALFALGGLSAVSQQDDGPVLRPKQPRVKQAEATLLVMCDIACNWKLDGVAQGLIEAGASAKTKVGPGLHLVAATTVDGLDQDQRSAKLETKEPTLVSIALRPVREARIKIKEDARKEMELQQREALRRVQEQAARELELREQRDKEQAAQEAVTQQAETLYKDRHYIDAIPLLEKSCTAGNSDTCEKLGSVYEEGKGIPKDYSRALALYSRACDTGNADGCNSFGAMYDIGRGVAKDDTRAAELYSKACDGGSAKVVMILAR